MKISPAFGLVLSLLVVTERAATAGTEIPSERDSVPIQPRIEANRTIPYFTTPSDVAVFSKAPTDQEISQARVFEEPLIAIGGMTTREENQLLAQALSAYLKAGTPADVRPFTHFLEKFPKSAWRAALLTDLGIVYRKTGYFSKALEAWEDAWKLAKDQTAPEARAICDRAVVELAELNSRLGRYERLEPLFAEIGNRDVRGSATERLLGAKQGLWLMQNKPENAFRCGPMALAKIKDLSNPSDSANEKIRASRSTAQGMSLSQVCDLSHDLELNYRMAKRQPAASVIIPAVIHWKAGHYAALVREAEGRYLIQDPTFGDEIWVERTVLDEEGSGYFLVPEKSLPGGWTSVSASEGEKIWGKGTTSSSEPDRVRSKDRKDPDNDDCKRQGMAYYNIHSLLVSLNVVDTPVGYAPPRGPAVRFTVTYNQRDANQPSIFSYSNLGPKWTFDWLSYVTDNPANPAAAARLYARGGGVESYTDFNGTTQSYALQPDSHTLLVRTSPTSYERRFVDGSKEIYDLPDGAFAFPRKVFLTRIVDSLGNGISFSYDSGFRLVAVTDAIGQVTTLSYALPGDALKLTKVTDPFGRFAALDYNASGQLIKITDAAGIASQFGYGGGDFINKLTTPYGDTTFTYGDTANGGATGTTRWLEVLDPAGARERTEYRDFAPGMPVSETAAPANMALFNTNLQVRNTFYWNKKAMQEAGGIYPKAKIIHWMHATDINVSAGVAESEKLPLESRVWYNYPGQPNVYTVGTLSLPSKIGRVLDDGTTQLYRHEYNSLGRMTKSTDPANRVTTYVYDPNGIDLKEVRLTTGSSNDLLASYTYNAQHLPLTVRDASGQTTTYTYYPSGQIQTVTNAKQETTTYGYDPSGYLMSITGPVAGANRQFTYDGFGRLRTMTDSEGYAVTTDYDAIGGNPLKTLDRITKVTYPDETYEEITYDRLDPEWTRDRLGRWSRRFHDPLRRVVATQDPLNRITTYDWCGCGSLDAITDANGNTTSWLRDFQGRVTDTVYPDDTRTHYTYEAATSRLLSSLDAKGQSINYQYIVDNNLKQISYTNAQIATPSVSYSYDPNYNRMVTMTDGTGVTAYSYNPITSTPAPGAGQLATVDGPLTDDTIAYGYDELGRATAQSINGAANASSVQFDALGRPTATTNALGTFAFFHVNATGRLDHVDLPNGEKTQIAYFDNLGDQRLRQIKHLGPGSSVISQFDYTYDPGGQIKTWTQANPGAANSKRYDFGYDDADQLRSAHLVDTGNGNAIQQSGYDYDWAGNRTNEQAGAAVATAVPNNLNQIISRAGGGKMHFRGTVNEPATVRVGGNNASVDAAGNFDGLAEVNVGNNTVPVVATDANGNSRTNNYEVTVNLGGSATFTYDLNGNLANDGSKKYEWDAANRLVAINYAGTSERSEFTYDGLSRRARIVEKTNGSVTSTKAIVWCGIGICEERDASNNVKRRYFAQGEQRIGGTDAGLYYYTRDHLGSIRQMTDGAGTLRARYEYDPWGATTKLTGDLDFDFGYTGHYRHAASNLYLAPYRAYDPAIGRWLNRDPIGEDGGLNLYGYVGNNPLNRTDPLGLCPWDWWDPESWGDELGDRLSDWYLDGDGYVQRYLDHVETYYINPGPYASALAVGVWPKSLAPGTGGRFTPFGGGPANPITSVPSAAGVPGARTPPVRALAAGVGVATVGAGFWNVGVAAGGLIYAAFPPGP